MSHHQHLFHNSAYHSSIVYEFLFYCIFRCVFFCYCVFISFLVSFILLEARESNGTAKMQLTKLRNSMLSPMSFVVVVVCTVAAVVVSNQACTLQVIWLTIFYWFIIICCCVRAHMHFAGRCTYAQTERWKQKKRKNKLMETKFYCARYQWRTIDTNWIFHFIVEFWVSDE